MRRSGTKVAFGLFWAKSWIFCPHVLSYRHFWDLSEIISSKINDRNHDSYTNSMFSNTMIVKYKRINVTLFVVNQNSKCALIVYSKVTFV